MDPRDVVRDGYDALSLRYRADDDVPEVYGPWIDRIVRASPAGGALLDVGCGCGVPVARELSAAGLAVTGIDVSPVQIQRARALVPEATFVCTDIVDADIDAASFDTVVALYSLIHVPVAAQPRVLSAFARWLRPGGTLLLTAGADAWTGSEVGWLGGEAAMWWSHADTATYSRWLVEAGFAVTDEDFVPEGSSGHSLFWATRLAVHAP